MARRKTSEEMELATRNEDVRATLKIGAAREVIWHILSLCDIYNHAFTGNTESMLYMEGRRSVGLDILQMLEDADPTAYPRLLLEKQDVTMTEEG